MKTDLFQFCGHWWVFQICWHIECSTFTASSFRIWSSSAGIPSPPLAFFVVMLPKAYFTSHSKMSGSRWVITPSWLSGSWRSFLYSFFFLIFICLWQVLAEACGIFDLCHGTLDLLAAACGIWFPDQGLNPGPLHWKLGVSATGPPGKCPLYSSVYSCHLFLISSASVRSLSFLSFIEPSFAWNVPLVSLIFLEEISSLSHSIVFLYFFALIRGRLSYLSLLFFGTLHSNGLIFLFFFTFRFPSFLSYL